MLLSTLLTISLLAAPQELSITKSIDTPVEIASFNGVEVKFEFEDALNIQNNTTVFIPEFPLGADREVKLRLQRFDIFTPDARVVVGTTNVDGEIVHATMKKPNLVLLRGAIYNEPDSKVFLALGENASNGLIESNGITYILTEHKEKKWTAVYNLNDVDPADMNWTDFQCDVIAAQQPIERKAQNAKRSIGGDCQALQIAIDTDWEFTGNLFGGSTSASGEYAATLLGAVSSIYERDVNVELQISYLRLWANSSDPWSAGSTGNQLTQFRSYWESNMSDVDRHLAHLFSGRGLGGGIAWVGATCTSFGYAVSANLSGSFPLPLVDHSHNNWDVMVVAHELGHNCGTWHTHDYSPPIDNCGNGDCTDPWGGTIMSYCHTCSGGMSNIVLSLHPRVQTTIEDYFATLSTCNLDCNPNITGVCCIDESCSETLEEECLSSGGLFLGTGTLCIADSCDPTPPGACCTGEIGACEELDVIDCADSGGVFLGSGTNCSSGWCAPDAPFACCIDFTCEDTTQSACDKLGGEWGGIGVPCSSGICNPLPNDFCEIAEEIAAGVWIISTEGALSDDDPYDNDECASTWLGGMNYDVWFKHTPCTFGTITVSTCGLINFDSDIVVYVGECNDDDDGNGEELIQIACNGDGYDEDGYYCDEYSSVVEFSGSSNETYFIRVGGSDAKTGFGRGQIFISGDDCEPDVPCVGDANGDGMVNIDDLLGLIDCWGGTPLTTDCTAYDIDGDGVVNVIDMLLIISNWDMCNL
jgi:hypothetical protein